RVGQPLHQELVARARAPHARAHGRGSRAAPRGPARGADAADLGTRRSAATHEPATEPGLRPSWPRRSSAASVQDCWSGRARTRLRKQTPRSAPFGLTRGSAASRRLEDDADLGALVTVAGA